VRKVLRLDDAAGGGGEDEPLVLIPLAHQQFPLGQRDAVPLERPECPLPDGDGPVPTRLGGAEDVAASVPPADGEARTRTSGRLGAQTFEQGHCCQSRVLLGFVGRGPEEAHSLIDQESREAMHQRPGRKRLIAHGIPADLA
jgi:hypothetical protein